MAFLYLALRRVLELVALCFRSTEFKELEIVVLRHELEVLRRQVGRPRLRQADRVLLAAASRLLPRSSWSSLFVSPETVLRWHRRLVARRWSYPHKRLGRPTVSLEVGQLILRLARENPRWGYQRIAGELKGLGMSVSATTVRKLLRESDLRPAGERGGLAWREFVRAQAAGIIACDFFTVDTLWLGRLYVFFFIELGTRRVHLAGCTAYANRSWVVQQARQFAWSLSERALPTRFLIRDRDSKYTAVFDEIFRSERIEVIRTPIRAPKANAYAERFVGTVRRECLGWILILSRAHLEGVLRVYVDHYNGHRPHRALKLVPPDAAAPTLRLVGTGVGCQNSVRAPGNLRFAGRTLILAPHRPGGEPNT
jgi:putative transposase